MLRLLFLVPLLPLIGAIINGVLGRAFRFTERTVAAIACGVTGLSLLVALGAIIDYSTSVAPAFYRDSAAAFTWFDGGLGRTIAGTLKPFRVEWLYQIANRPQLQTFANFSFLRFCG